MASKVRETREAIVELIIDELAKIDRPAFDPFYKSVITQTLNFIWGKHYRKDYGVDFTVEDPWIEWYVRDMLIVVGEVLDELRDELPSDEARERLDCIKSAVVRA